MILDCLMMVMIVVLIYTVSIRYQKNFENAQPIKVDAKFSENFPAGKDGFVLVLTSRLVSISSDGQRMCDLV